MELTPSPALSPQPRPGWLFLQLGRLTISLSHRPRLRPLLNGVIQAWFALLIVERRRGGHRLWGFSRNFLVRYGRARAPLMATQRQVRSDRMSDLAKLQDLEDQLFGVTGSWITMGQTQAVKHETQCPFAEQLKACPEICSELIHAMETATFTTLNPSYTLAPLTSLLSKGHDHCAFVHAIDRPDEQIDV